MGNTARSSAPPRDQALILYFVMSHLNDYSKYFLVFKSVYSGCTTVDSYEINNLVFYHFLIHDTF